MIGKVFQQLEGEKLKVLEKTIIKDKSGEYLYRCQFLKYPYEVIISKGRILKGNILNPQIEQVEFIDKIWPQNCGDSLKIIKKITEGENKGKWECEFQRYFYKIIIRKDQIIKGIVLNPRIEEEEFIKKEWPQNCGDIIRVIKKSEKRKGNNYYFECEFIKYPCKVLSAKGDIISGNVFNYQIEQNEFIGKEFLQKCGDTLKILEKTNKRNSSQKILYKCKFLKYEFICYNTKGNILKREVDNPALPWKSKENLEKYIQENFKEKPTSKTLSLNLNKPYSSIIFYIKKIQFI